MSLDIQNPQDTVKRFIFAQAYFRPLLENFIHPLKHFYLGEFKNAPKTSLGIKHPFHWYIWESPALKIASRGRLSAPMQL